MHKKIKYFLFLILFFCNLAFVYPEVVDKILVIVNDEIITQGEIDRIILPMYNQWKMLYNSEELAKRLDEARHNILERLIDDKLLLSEAKRKKIEIEEDQIDARVEEVRKRFPTKEEFEKNLARENITLGELKEKYKERMMIDKLIDMQIKGTVSVSPNEIISYYDKNKDKFKEPGKAKVRSIIIKISEARSEEKAMELAKQILARLQEGADFAGLAKEYSDGPHRETGGDMGWVKENELMPKINSLIFNMNKNEISGILRTKLGFHIFKVEEKMPAQPKEFQDVKNQIEKTLFNQKIEKKLGQWIEKLKKDAYIAFR